MKPVRVDMLYFAKLAELTGAATVLRSLMHGFGGKPPIILHAWARDACALAAENIATLTAAASTPAVAKGFIPALKQQARSLLELLAKHSGLMALLLVWLTYFGGGRKVVRRYQGQGDWLFFHEIFTPAAFRRQHPAAWHGKRKLLVLHCDGDPLKMLFGYYPALAQNRITRAYFQRLLHRLFADVETIVLLGQRAQQRFGVLFPRHADKTRVVPNGLADSVATPAQPGQNPAMVRFVTVGTVGKRKGHDLLLAAMAGLSAAERARLELHIVGDGAIRPHLQAQCRQAQWQNVLFHGAQADVLPFLAAADVFILASRDEGLPMAIIEAMRAGLPVVATDVGDCADLLAANNGWLVSPEAGAIAEAIRQAMAATDLAARGTRSRAHYRQHYSLAAMCSGYAALFNVPPLRSPTSC